MEKIIIVNEVKGADYYNAMKLAIEKNTRSSFVTLYKEEEYGSMKHLFLLEDGQAGLCVKHDGDIVSIFKDPTNEAQVKNVIDLLLPIAIINGGNKMDCFGKLLTSKYMANGFIPVAKVPFTDEYAPECWNYERDGRPHIYFLCRYSDSIERLLVDKAKFTCGGVLDKIEENIPEVTCDEAVSFQTKVLKMFQASDLSYEDVINHIMNGFLIKLYQNNNYNGEKR